jgi:hypothetical protein
MTDRQIPDAVIQSRDRRIWTTWPAKIQTASELLRCSGFAIANQKIGSLSTIIILREILERLSGWLVTNCRHSESLVSIPLKIPIRKLDRVSIMPF